jgi:hypothetical protein
MRVLAISALFVAVGVTAVLLGIPGSRPTHEAVGVPQHLLILANYSASAGTAPPSERVQTTTTIANGQITISPAPADSQPTVSQQTAANNAAGTGMGGASTTAIQPVVLYGLYSNSAGPLPPGVVNPEAVPANATPMGTPTAYVNYPVWISEYKGMAIPAFGGRDPSSTPPPSYVAPDASGYQPIFYIFTDANTGKVLGAVSS